MSKLVSAQASAQSIKSSLSRASSRKFFSEGSNFFLVNEWIQIPLKSGHHRPASETPFKWYFAGMSMMAQH